MKKAKLLTMLVITIMLAFCCSNLCFAEFVSLSDEAADLSADISKILGTEGEYYVIDTDTTITFNAQLWSISVGFIVDEWTGETVYDYKNRIFTDKCIYSYEKETVHTLVYEKEGEGEYEIESECIKKGSVLKILEPGKYIVSLERTSSVDDINANFYPESKPLRLIVRAGANYTEKIFTPAEKAFRDMTNPGLFAVSKVVDVRYDEESYNDVATCINEATFTAVSDLDTLVIEKMKKVEGGWDHDYYILGDEDAYSGSNSSTYRQKAGFIIKLQEKGRYSIGVKCEDSSYSAVIEITDANAKSTTSKVMVNGKEIQFEAYNINGNNYFKLRDVAKALSGTSKQFEVEWDPELKSIHLISNKPYTEVGGELLPGDGKAKVAEWGTGTIYANYFINYPLEIKPYLINGNNYFKLRDLGNHFDFGVDWDGENNCVLIDSENSYTE